jgi:anti-anti-sigma regulatory factor
MEFKIDTKKNYTLITPVADAIDADLAVAISEKCRELTENGSANYIIDMQQCVEADTASFEELLSLHEFCYSNGQSLVFIGVTEPVLEKMKPQEVQLALNIAPTLIEAADIVSMEILERDLFNEE